MLACWFVHDMPYREPLERKLLQGKAAEICGVSGVPSFPDACAVSFHPGQGRRSNDWLRRRSLHGSLVDFVGVLLVQTVLNLYSARCRLRMARPAVEGWRRAGVQKEGPW